MTRKEKIQFNDGVWFAIQNIIVGYDQPTIAKDILKQLKMDKKEMRRCQKKSGYMDEIMKDFINNCD